MGAGTIQLRVLTLLKASCLPNFIERRRMAEKALTPVIQRAMSCMSTRSVDDLVKAMGMSGICESQVSRL